MNDKILHILEGKGKTPRLRSFQLDDVYYFKADNRYIDIYTLGKTSIVKTSLVKIKKSLDEIAPDEFMRLHRNCIVNLKHITQQRKTNNGGSTTMTLKVSNGDVLNVSRRNHSKINKIFKEKV